MKARYILLLLIGFLLLSGAARADDVYIGARAEASADHSNTHGMILLRAALEATTPLYGPYKLMTSPPIERKRLLREMVEGKQVNMTLQVVSPEWEQALIPIRIPVDKGMASFRIALIDDRRQDEFSRISSMQQLQQLSLGVGAPWVTRDIYEKDGLHVVVGDNHIGLFGMLLNRRFDYLPRSIEEAFTEQAEQASQYPHLAVEQSFALYAPLPRYFFISPKTPRLAERLRVGLEKLIENGEFDHLFVKYYGPMITKARLCTRTIFKISNPDLSADTPLRRPELWFDPFNAPGNELACKPSKNTVPKSLPHEP